MKPIKCNLILDASQQLSGYLIALITCQRGDRAGLSYQTTQGIFVDIETGSFHQVDISALKATDIWPTKPEL